MLNSSGLQVSRDPGRPGAATRGMGDARKVEPRRYDTRPFMLMPTAATVKATALLALVAGFALAAIPLRADQIPVDNFGFIRVNSYFSRLGQGDIFGGDNLWYVSSGTVDRSE